MANRIVDISEVQFSKRGRSKFQDATLLEDLLALQAGQACVWENGYVDMTQDAETIVTDRARVRANASSVIEQAGLKNLCRISFTIEGELVITLKAVKRLKK